jgi:hypothetical protein
LPSRVEKGEKKKKKKRLLTGRSLPTGTLVPLHRGVFIRGAGAGAFSGGTLVCLHCAFVSEAVLIIVVVQPFRSFLRFCPFVDRDQYNNINVLPTHPPSPSRQTDRTEETRKGGEARVKGKLTAGTSRPLEFILHAGLLAVTV